MQKRWVSVSLSIFIVIVAFLGGYLWHGIPDINQKNDSESDIYMPLIEIDSNTDAEKVLFYVRIPRHLSLREKCIYLADQLSLRRFHRLPIEVLSIEQYNDKRIAIINLVEPDGIRRLSWHQLFQGSSGGHCTELSLGLTFLQRDYGGEWIDGVQFLYDGNPICGFDHVPLLYGIIWRDTTSRL